MEHPEWLDLISAAADGELDEADAARLAGHLDRCDPCAALRYRFESDRRRARIRSGPNHSALVGAVVAARADDHREQDRTRAVLLRRSAAAAVGVAAAVAGLVLVTSSSTPFHPVRADPRHDALIAARNRTFDRADIEVPAGTTVEWRNAGTHTHHLVREFDGVTIDEELRPGTTEKATFERPGTFAYFCTIHPGMTGTVTVDA
jgi:plastocyanin